MVKNSSRTRLRMFQGMGYVRRRAAREKCQACLRCVLCERVNVQTARSLTKSAVLASAT